MESLSVTNENFILLPRPEGQGPIPIPPVVSDDSPMMEMRESELKKQVWVSFNKGYNDGFVAGFHSASLKRPSYRGRGRGRGGSNRGKPRATNSGQGYRLAANVANAPPVLPVVVKSHTNYSTMPVVSSPMYEKNNYRRVLSEPLLGVVKAPDGNIYQVSD